MLQIFSLGFQVSIIAVYEPTRCDVLMVSVYNELDWRYCVLFLLVVFGSICLCRRSVLAVRRSRVVRKHNCKSPPAVPQRDPFFGLDIVFEVLLSMKKRKRNASFEQLFKKYGSTFQSRVYNTTKIFTIEPKNLQAVFAADFDSWGVEPVRLFFFEPFVGRGIMTTDGPLWQHSRDLIRPTFSRVQLANLSAYNVHVDRLLDLIPLDGAIVDLKPLFEKLALDSSTELLFGTSTASLTPNTSIDAKAFLQAYNYGQLGVGRRMQLLPWNFLTRDQQFWRSCGTARAFVTDCVQKSAEQHSKRPPPTGKPVTSKLVLAQELLSTTGDVTEITNQLLNVFLPAHDATAVALTNIFFHLARHPEKYAKLSREVMTMTSKDLGIEWTFERLKSCRYLQNVMRETFRLNPSIGQMSRAALRDTILPTGGGPDGTSPIFVKKGTVLTTSFYALHRLSLYFGADANEWRPERWDSLKAEPWTYLPFGGGPRICIGQQLALTEVSYAVVKIVARFPRIERADPVLEFVEDWKITTVSANGAKLRLFKD